MNAATAAALRALADKAITRVALGVGMTELMPDDVRLLQRAAQLLDPMRELPAGVLQAHHDHLAALPRPRAPELIS